MAPDDGAMADPRRDTRPLLERGSIVWWLVGLAATAALGLHFATDVSKPVTVFVYLLVLSVFTFVVFWLDKRRATKEGARRVAQKVLFGLSAFGGAAGGLAAMSLFRHKTKRWSFRILLPLFTLIHVGVLMWLSGWFETAS